MKRNHDLQAAGLNLKQVELLDAGADGTAADLLDDSYAVVGVNDFIAYVKTSVGADLEGTPTSAGKLRNRTLLF